MKRTGQLFLVAAAGVFLAGCSPTGTPQPAQTNTQQSSSAAPPAVNISGRVTDVAGNPVAGATVDYWSREGDSFWPGAMKMEKQTTSGTNGAFEFTASDESGVLMAHKPGLVPAWQQLGQPYASTSTGIDLALTAPGTLAGVVVDESNQPAANVVVSVVMAFREASRDNGMTINYLIGQAARENFSAHTDGAGHFRIENFPTNAGAIFAVYLPGKVLRPDEEQNSEINSGGYRAGDPDIKLVVEAAGAIEGKITGGEAGQPLPAARLTLQPDENRFMGSTFEPVQSGADGTFRFDDVAAGSYRIQADFGVNTSSLWVAEAVTVSVESGQVTRAVKITAQRGALLDVSVLNEATRQPVARVNVTAYQQNFLSSAVSDSKGIARLNLLPGDYQINAFRQFMAASSTSASVEAGVTNRVEIEIAGPRKVSGVVRRPDGQPAASVEVQTVGAFGAMAAKVRTDANGRFEIDWIPRRFNGQNETPCLLVRDVKQNLAAAQDLDEDTTNVDLQLAPALTLAGRGECDGQPVTNTTATLVFWTDRSGTWLEGLALTNTPTPGQFEIPALPPGRKYGVIVSAPGYGQKQLYNFEVSAEAGREDLDLVELKPANLRLAGQVLDADDKPVAGCMVNLYGEDQPNAHVRTDRQGRFNFPHVCEGPAQLNANSQSSFGGILAEGGETNVVLQLGQNVGSVLGATMHKLQGTITDADGKPVAGAKVKVFPSNGSGWATSRSDGKFNLIWSLQPWQSGDATLVVRDAGRNLAATEDLSENVTNLDVQLKPALTLSGQVKGEDDAPLSDAEVGLWLKAGNTYEPMDDRLAPVNPQGRYEIKCLPPEAQYVAFATAPGHGRSQQPVQNDSETNHLELPPFVLKLADRVIAGQVLNEDDKPISGANVQLNGDGQPDGYMTTDSKGRFHFKVCEGQVRLFAYSQNGAGNAQATVEAGDTNIVMTLTSQQGNFRHSPHRPALRGSPLPDLTTVNLAADAAPAGRPVLLCLFDAGQRPSRHIIAELEQQSAALRQRNVTVLGVQAVATSDDIFNGWKNGSPVSFPVGRVAKESGKSKWASGVSALPWLILADANHRVVAEGFSLDTLDNQLQKLK